MAKIASGKKAEELFTRPVTKPTISTKYIPPIPTSPPSTKKIYTSAKPYTPYVPLTPYRPPVKYYEAKPAETTVLLTTVEITTTNSTTIETTELPEISKKIKTVSTTKSTTKARKKKINRLNLKPGLPTKKDTGLDAAAVSAEKVEPISKEEMVVCSDIDAIKVLSFLWGKPKSLSRFQNHASKRPFLEFILSCFDFKIFFKIHNNFGLYFLQTNSKIK